MLKIRSLIVALIAISVTWSPIGAFSASAFSQEPVSLSVGLDDCAGGVACEGHMDGCSKMSGCLLKCFSVFATLPGSSRASLGGRVSEKLRLSEETAKPPIHFPPSPPPRV